jgi:hypothetical protein
VAKAVLRVLIAFESSGTVREAFRALGCDAWSCDLLPADDGSPFHAQADALTMLTPGRWDLIIMHPPCTALCVSGNSHYAAGKPKHAERLASIAWTVDLWHRATEVCDHICMENPVGVLPLKATQWIQPYEFGHPESKRTGLWLHGLPLLRPTKILECPTSGRWHNQTPSGQNRLGPSADRWKVRAKTYSGIAQAMATQWCAHIDRLS